MREWQSDRLLFFDEDVAGTAPPPVDDGPRPNTLAAVVFLLAILLAIVAALYVLVAWHVPRMH